MEDWRKKAIEILATANDSQLAPAIEILKEGKGYLTKQLPIKIIFYEDMPHDDHGHM